MKGAEGNKLEHAMGVKTESLDPAHNYVPWVKTFWTDSFKWDLVKSVSLFVIGIILARFVNSKNE